MPSFSNFATVYCSVAKLCQLFCDTMPCSPPDSSVHWTSHARILEWVSIFFSWGFPTEESSLSMILWLLHWQASSLQLSHQGSLLLQLSHFHLFTLESILVCFIVKWKMLLNFCNRRIKLKIEFELWHVIYCFQSIWLISTNA